MQIKLLQLNMWGGGCFDNLKKYLLSHDYDILCFQEVTGPHWRNGGKHFSNQDMYEELKKLLGNRYQSELAIAMHFSSDPLHSYQAEAIFYRNDFTLKNKEILTLYKGLEPFPSEFTRFEEVGRNALCLTLEKEEKTFEIINTHLAWAPTPIEQPHQTEQNAKLLSFVERLHHPFILTGDFNLSPDQPTVLKMEKHAQNLTKEYGITNTLDPKNHKIFENVGHGAAVDYIFTSPQITVKDFTVVDEDLSDHLGLEVMAEI